MTVRVVLADDHPMVRYGIEAVLADSEEVEIVGTASSGEQLLALVAERQPDVVLTDLSMPGMNGAEAVARLRQRHPGVATLVLTMHTHIGDRGQGRRRRRGWEGISTTRR